MVDEMLVAQAQWLPQYEEALEPTKQRILNNTVKTKNWAGAARKKVRNVAELKEDVHASLMVEDDAFQPKVVASATALPRLAGRCQE